MKATSPYTIMVKSSLMFEVTVFPSSYSFLSRTWNGEANTRAEITPNSTLRINIRKMLVGCYLKAISLELIACSNGKFNGMLTRGY